jgi:serine/threonine protein kinase
MFNIGDVINNQYILLDIIGEGNFSTVWLAYDIKKIKIYSLKFINDDDIKGIGENETYILKYIKKKIPSVEKYKKNLLLYDNILNNLNHIIIVENFQNLTLRDLLSNYELTKNDKNVLLNKMNDIENTIKLLIKYKILHTDIKPENIFIEIINNEYYNLNENLINCIKKLTEYGNNTKINKQNKLKHYNLIINDYIKRLKEICDKNNKKYLEDSDEEESETSTEDENIMTDSDIHSDFNIQENIDDYLNNIIIDNFNNTENTEDNKKSLDFDLNNIKLSIGDFGNAINYNNNDEYEQLITSKYHDMQTRYYRDPNLIIRNNDIFTTDLYAYRMIIEEIKKDKIIINPHKNNQYTTDHEHLRKLINNKNNIKFLNNYKIKGRKLDIFFDYDKILNGYFLKK